jgi:hypothetical protein
MKARSRTRRGPRNAGRNSRLHSPRSANRSPRFATAPSIAREREALVATLERAIEVLPAPGAAHRRH